MKQHIADTGSLARELARLPHLDRPALVERWQFFYGNAVPVNISRSLLILAIAYRMQEQVLGDLKLSPQRFHNKAAEDASAERQPGHTPIIRPGMRLLREWHGITHEVTIGENGISFNGKQYQSLSEVARIITGTRWSGPLFFGVKHNRRIAS